MREIKFRAWNNRISSMSYDVTLYANGWMECAFENGHEDKYPPKVAKEFLTIMQYTGLKDKNGVEIYEGDIVESEKGIHVVNYYLSQFELDRVPKVQYRSDNNLLLSEWYDCCEVIGNIYANPVLLEVAE